MNNVIVAFQNTLAYNAIYIYTTNHQGRVKIGQVTLKKDILAVFREDIDGAGKVYHNGGLSFAEKPDKHQR